jgi:hypothetical protein
MNHWRMGTLGVFGVVCASLFATAQGCVIVTTNDPTLGDSGGTVPPPLDSGNSDSSDPDAGFVVDSGNADSGGQTCAACQQQNCTAETSGCSTAKADGSNVIKDPADTKYNGQTYCYANLSERNACYAKFTVQSDIDKCVQFSDAAYSEGKAGVAALDACIVAKCKSPCKL